MAWVADNTARWSKLLATLVCALAVLLAQTPCAMAMAPAAQLSPMSIASPECGTCCSHAGFEATTLTCCAAHSQPAEGAAVYSAPDALSKAIAVPAGGLPAVLRRTTQGNRETSLLPPRLPSILRI